jgi:hypothetical protein
MLKLRRAFWVVTNRLLAHTLNKPQCLKHFMDLSAIVWIRLGQLNHYPS